MTTARYETQKAAHAIAISISSHVYWPDLIQIYAGREHIMPKRTSTARSGAQRNKSQVQKNIRLVHPDQNMTEKAEKTVALAAREDTKQEIQHTPRPGSAAAKIVARRLTMQKMQQRASTSLITAEHFAYVKQDLIRISIFATIMFTAIITLYLVIGHA
jgi:hypothetical protein